jgi:flagellin-like protein
MIRKRAISPLIATIILIMIVIIGGFLVYNFFFSASFLGSSGQVNVENTQLVVDSSGNYVLGVSLKNGGTKPVTSLSLSFNPGSLKIGKSSYVYRPIIITSSSGLNDYQVFVTNLVYNESGLVLSLHFDNVDGSMTSDSSGNNNNAILLNNPTWTSGRFGGGLSLDGINDIAYAPLGTWLGQSNHPWTVMAWFYSPADGGPIIGITNSPPGGGWNMPFMSLGNNGYLYGWAWGGGMTSYYVGFNKWVFGVVTYSPSSGVTLYVNGVRVGNDPNPYYSASGSFDYWTTYIPGARPGGVPSYFHGVIDEVRIYDRMLSDSEIFALYQARARLDYADVRFYDSDGVTLFNYWMEADGRFWVRVPYIPSGTKTIYAVYGDPNLSSASSVQNTFIPNQIFVMEGSCTDATYCGYMDNHAEADVIRTFPANIGTLYVDRIDWGSPYDGSPFSSNVRDQFYARFRYIFVPDVSGTWYFATDSDDGSELVKSNGDMFGIHEHTIIATFYGGHGPSWSTNYNGPISLVKGQGVWFDYLYEEWYGGEGGRVYALRPGDSWKILNVANFPNMIFARRYVFPEPKVSLGNEELSFTVSLNIVLQSGSSYFLRVSSTDVPYFVPVEIGKKYLIVLNATFSDGSTYNYNTAVTATPA